MEELIFKQNELNERYQRWVKKASVASIITTAPDYNPDYDVCANPPYSFHRFTRYIGETFGEKHAEAYAKAIAHYQIKLRQAFELQSADVPAGKLLNKTEGHKFKSEVFDMAWFSARFGVFWVPDIDVDNCPICMAGFSFLNRKHHCRMCGRVVCDGCSKGRRRAENSTGLERACKDCCLTEVDPQPCCDPPSYKPLQYQPNSQPHQPQSIDAEVIPLSPSFAEERPQHSQSQQFSAPPPPQNGDDSGDAYVAPVQYQFYQPQTAPFSYQQPQPQPRHPQQPRYIFSPPAPYHSIPQQMHGQQPLPQQQLQQPPQPQQAQPPPPSQQPQPQGGYDPSTPVTYQTNNPVPFTPSSAAYPNLYSLFDSSAKKN